MTIVYGNLSDVQKYAFTGVKDTSAIVSGTEVPVIASTTTAGKRLIITAVTWSIVHPTVISSAQSVSVVIANAGEVLASGLWYVMLLNKPASTPADPTTVVPIYHQPPLIFKPGKGMSIFAVHSGMTSNALNLVINYSGLLLPTAIADELELADSRTGFLVW